MQSTCPVCKSLSDFFISCKSREFDSEKFDLFKCKNCCLVFINPMPLQNELQKYYSEQYYEKPGILLDFLQFLRIERFSKMKKGSLLDIGCGSGSFAKAMAKNGWKAAGFDVSIESKKYFNGKSNPKFFFGTLNEMDFRKESFDLITLWHVLEHIQDPEKEICEIGRILKSNGVLMIAVPNIESFTFKLFKCNWLHLDVPRHVFQYSPQSLKFFLEKNGFAVKRTSHCSFEYNPFGLMQSIYNALGVFEFNLIYLKIIKGKKTDAGIFQTVLSVALLPILALLSLFFSCLFSFFGAGDAIEIYAQKK